MVEGLFRGFSAFFALLRVVPELSASRSWGALDDEEFFAIEGSGVALTPGVSPRCQATSRVHAILSFSRIVRVWTDTYVNVTSKTTPTHTPTHTNTHTGSDRLRQVCVTVFSHVNCSLSPVFNMSLHGDHEGGAAKRRRDRRLRIHWRHEQLTPANGPGQQPFIAVVMLGP